MQTLSSASRTCMASASAVECTATVGMPSSLQARSTRSAISPRLAIRIFSNIRALSLTLVCHGRACPGHPRLFSWHRRKTWMPATSAGMTETVAPPSSLHHDQRLAEFDWLAILEQNLRDRSRARRRDLVHGLHGFDDQERVAGLHRRADVD